MQGLLCEESLEELHFLLSVKDKMLESTKLCVKIMQEEQVAKLQALERKLTFEREVKLDSGTVTDREKDCAVTNRHMGSVRHVQAQESMNQENYQSIGTFIAEIASKDAEIANKDYELEKAKHIIQTLQAEKMATETSKYRLEEKLSDLQVALGEMAKEVESLVLRNIELQEKIDYLENVPTSQEATLSSNLKMQGDVLSSNETLLSREQSVV